jgi:hypothetical protein
MAKKVVKYTEPMLVRLSRAQNNELEKECAKLEMNEAVYARKAILLSLKKHLINSNQ